MQEKQKWGNVLNIHKPEQSNPNIKEWVKDNFPYLCVRIRKSKNYVMRLQFSKDIVLIQQKGRCIPVHLRERVEKELNKLIDQKHIIKLDKCSDRQFISPIVITVKKDQTMKLALDSKSWTNLFTRINIKYLQVVKSNKNQQTLFSTFDLRYAYSQTQWIS